MRVTHAIFGLGCALTVGTPAPGTAQETYPWCTQGETLHCYYATREQCEATVDYHGFCVANPEASSIGQNARQSHRPQRGR
jgi:hypothetical protein